ncbi:MAG TPA: capsule assembly Wzi family protein [Termitinemataceae bacterium]|nr:capsule assembly Wzi family protein [Termitinemataceae bacterium]HPQ01623.1 capsule assembly Wzi family protein [Termitinemataceae bacterium]
MKKLFSLFLALCSGIAFLNALEIEIQNQSVASSEIVPLWIEANRYGSVLTDTTLQSHVRSRIRWDSTFFNGNLRWITEGSGSVGFSEAFNPLVTMDTLYTAFQYGLWEFRGGWFQETLGEVFEPLSSGSMAVSSNARPMPRIEFRLTDWYILPWSWTEGLIAIKGGIQHGWFEPNNYVDNVWLHAKWAYLRLGTEQQHIFGGLVHLAQWGGKGSYNGEDFDIPFTFHNWWQTFVAGGVVEGQAEIEKYNASGNHLGIWDLGTKITISGFELSAYYQHFFEDKASLDIWSNGLDGLFGLHVKTPSEVPFLRHVLIEKVITTDQSGPQEEILLTNPDNTTSLVNIYGGDSYYFNYLYKTGWSYLGRILGTPLITGTGSGEDFRVNNNRIDALHIGGLMEAGTVTIRALYTYTKRFPAYSEQSLVSYTTWAEKLDYRNHKDRWDGYLGISFPLGPLTILGEFAGGYDQIFGWNWGSAMTVGYRTTF